MREADACLIAGFCAVVAGCWVLFGIGWALLAGGLILMAVGRGAYRAHSGKRDATL